MLVSGYMLGLAKSYSQPIVISKTDMRLSHLGQVIVDGRWNTSGTQTTCTKRLEYATSTHSIREKHAFGTQRARNGNATTVRGASDLSLLNCFEKVSGTLVGPESS